MLTERWDALMRVQVVLEAQTRSLPIMVAFIVGSWCVGVPSAFFFGLCQGRRSLSGIWGGMTLGYIVTSFVGFYHAYFQTDWELEAKLAVERSREKPEVTEDTPLLPK
jgi:Na+-driven multidrug efflux pump